MRGQRNPLTFRQRDLARAIRAAQAAGLRNARVTVDPGTGKITVEAGESQRLESSDLDQELAEFEGRHREG